MLLTIVSTMLHISALMKQQRLFTVVETGKSNIDRTSLVAIVIIVVTVLIVEQCCKNICVKSSTENKNSSIMLRMEIIWRDS